MLKLFKKETEQEKLQGELDSIVFKKNTLLASETTDKADNDAQKQAIYEKIGLVMFTCHCEQKDVPDLTPLYLQLQGLQQEMAEKTAKYQDLILRYDEEIAMLQASPAVPEVVQEDEENIAFCGNCGQQLKSIDIFCPSCGTKKV
ncbi:MAG: zinc ribbon domain-containing protein [Eubacteriales bacterium]